MESDHKQQVFEKCYRGRQSALHHMAYLRMSKVLPVLEILKRVGFSAEDRDIFDYGFGAGTFFRYLPRTARLFGVEIDDENVAAVRQMLLGRGYASVDLRSIRIESWASHPLLARDYDMFHCSHVLEHMRDPLEFLRRIRCCVRSDGIFVGLVPINERKANPHHLHQITHQTIATWARDAGFNITEYFETDPWTYWMQPLFAHDTGWQHRASQAFSLSIGLPATLLGPEMWSRLSRTFAALTRSLPTQAAFVLVPAT